MCDNCLRFNAKGTAYHAEGLRTKALSQRLASEVVADLRGADSDESKSLQAEAVATALASEKMATEIEEAEKREAQEAARMSGASLCSLVPILPSMN